MKVIHRNDNIHTPRSRDDALRRLSRVNRWLIAGTAVLTGVLTDVAANAFPGHTVRKSSTRAGAPARSHAKHKPLQSPAQAPKPDTTTQQAPPPAAETSEAPPAETETAPAETAPAETAPPVQETAPEPAPAEEAPRVEAAPPPPEEPVVSGGS